MLNSNQFKFIRTLPLAEVINIWAINENAENAPHWTKFWKNMGLSSWEEWRKPYIDAISFSKDEWKLYKILDPIMSIPEFRGGPYKGWHEKFYDGKILPKFKDMKVHPVAEQYYTQFPHKTTLIAWETDKGLVIIEGMHRCTGITYAWRNHLPIRSQVYIVTTECNFSDLPDFITNPPHQKNN